ncbi:hypothetical protein DMENIID0001_032320 [Sergentomyia squamirostris]
MLSAQEQINKEVPCPDWLNGDFFIDIYNKDPRNEGKKITATVKKCSAVVDVGDNYTSTMYRVNVEATFDGGEAQSDNFIVKAMIHMTEAFKDFSVFPIEIEAYEQALPAMEGFWREIGQEVEFGPKCLHTISEPNEIIVLSDLRDKGFVMANRFEGLDMQHSKLLLAQLARFHASSVIYKQRNEKFGPRLGREVFDRKMKKVFDSFFATNFTTFLTFIESVESLKPYYDKCEKWRHNMFERIIKTSNVSQDTSEFCVLNHSDMWINNHMYKYDENGSPTDVIFIDFQMSHWGRPSIDLMYFMFSSVRPEIVVQEYDTLIAHYHSILVDSLIKLGYEKTPPLLKDIHIQILQNSAYGALCLPGITAVVLMDKNEDAKMENFFSDGDAAEKMRQKMFFNPRFENKLKLFLPFFEKRGLLEVEDVPESEIIPDEPAPVIPTPATDDSEVPLAPNDNNVEAKLPPEEPSRESLAEAVKEDEQSIQVTPVVNGVKENGVKENGVEEVQKDAPSSNNEVKENNAFNKETNNQSSDDIEVTAL